MVETDVSHKSTTSRMKRLLIPVLAAVLIGMLASGDEDPESDASDSGVADSQTTESDTSSVARVPKRHRARPWPAISLKETLQHNPFRFPSYLVSTPANPETQADVQADTETSDAVLVDERMARTQQLVAQLQTKRVSVFLQTEKGTAAVIDSKIYHEGDLFMEGVRIRKIGPDGVTFDLEDIEGE